MWHRLWWTDASTMHMLILSMWLIVEANYQWYKPKINHPEHDKTNKVPVKYIVISTGLAIAAGAALGASISTRYPVAITIVAPIIFLIIYQIKRSWQNLRKRRILKAIKDSKGMFIILEYLY